MKQPGAQQLDFFASSKQTPHDLAQRARAARDTGMLQAASKCPAQVDAAYQELVKLARTRATIHIDDFLPVLDELPVKPSPNAMGTIWLRAKRAGILAETGQYRACIQHERKHSHKYPIYRSLVFSNSG